MFRPARLLAAALALVSTLAFGQPIPVAVEFTLRAPNLPKGVKVYLSGGTPSLGNWAPDAVPMDFRGDGTWHKVVLFSQSMPVEYRYTLGSEERVAADERGQPLPRFSIRTRRNLEVRDEVVAWTDEATELESPGQVTGDLRHHRHVRNAVLPARDIAVWLPRFYELQDRRDYPVLYLNDGQDLFDPATATGGRDWGVDEALDHLIETQAIEPMIVVGIYSTDERLAEYAPGDQGEAYMRFVVDTVKPLIDRRYRTRPGRQHTFVGGAAMGGLIAAATAWRYPEVFGASISLSPTFRVAGRIDALPWFEARAGSEPRPVFFYFDSGSLGADALVLPGVEAMVEALKGWGYRPERHYVLVRDLDAYPGAEAWSRRFPDALTRAIRGAQRLEALSQHGEPPTRELQRRLAARASLSGQSPAAGSSGGAASATR